MKKFTSEESVNLIAERAVSRRKLLFAGGVGIAAVAGAALPAEGTEWSAAEKANAQEVTDFCAAWPSHELDKIMFFFAPNCAYRLMETLEPAKGRQAVIDQINGILTIGPLAIVSERIDHFNGGPLKSWHGVGVFFLKDGKIVEWYDYTIAIERA